MQTEKQKCPTCHQNISERKIALYSGLVTALWKVYKWAVFGKGVHEFTRKDIKHLFTNENETARFGDWVMFGGLVYKKGKASYGLNKQRCEEFFSGKIKIPSAVWKNPVTQELTPVDYKSVNEMPNILKFLDSDGVFISRYRKNKAFQEVGVQPLF